MKKIFKKLARPFVLLLVLTQLAASCSLFGGLNNTPSEPPVTLVIWRVFEDEQTLRPVMDAYSQLHPNVQFRYERKDIAGYEDALLNALAAGAGPDIYSIHNDWLPKYQDKMAPAPAGLFTARDFRDAFIDVAWEDLTASGELYAIPFNSDVLALFYNRDMLGSAGIAQPPRTWNEMIDAVKKLTRQDRLGNFVVNGVAMGTSTNINRATDILSLLMLQNGTQVYNTSRSVSTIDREISSPDGDRYNPGAQAIEFFTQFANPAKETYTWNAKNNYSIDAFVAGQTAMIFGYSYLVPTIRNKAPLLNFGIAPVPQIDLTRPKVNFANYFAESVSKASPNAAVAWDFLKFASSAEQMRKMYEVHPQPAARKDIISEQIGDHDLGVFAEGALTAKTFYKPDAAKVESILARAIDEVVLRGKTPQQSVSTVNQLLSDLLRTR